MKKTLAEDFKKRHSFFTNRASAIWPIYFFSQENDLILSWLNYWTIKNSIYSENISINLRLYDASGGLLSRHEVPLHAANNTVSVRQFVKDDIFHGMVEIEVISTSNLKFTFPAISGIFKSGSLYSSVHSAGRIKGSDENNSRYATEETNWSCKFGVGITPFFHYINGNRDEETCISVKLYNVDGKLVNIFEIKERFSAFASKIYLIDELFQGLNSQDGMFVGVVCNNDSVFRRMVVGNYHRNFNHLEVTHSFPRQEIIDYCPNNNDGYEAFLAIYNNQSLLLTCRVFPTNCSNEFEVAEASQMYGDQQLSEVTTTSLLSNGFGNVDLANDVCLKVLYLSGERVPSRLNTNFIYSVKGIKSNFSTDIATGAKSSVYPPKYSHWGSGIFGNGYDFTIMLRNLKHDLNGSPTKGNLMIYGLDKCYDFEVKVDAQSATSLVLSDLLVDQDLSNYKTQVSIFSWFLKLDQPNSETFWVSFRKEDGCILGEHGF